MQSLLKGLKCDAPNNESELLEDEEIEPYQPESGNNEGPIKKVLNTKRYLSFDFVNVFSLQLRKLISKIRCSGQRRQKFEKACQYERIRVLQLKMDVHTRWNSTYQMIERALRMKKVLDLM